MTYDGSGSGFVADPAHGGGELPKPQLGRALLMAAQPPGVSTHKLATPAQLSIGQHDPQQGPGLIGRSYCAWSRAS
jgi:hypothetical protein